MLAGRTAVITGAGRGIGAATAKLFAAHGANVVLNDLHAGPAQDVTSEISKGGGKAIAIAGSVTDDGFPEELLGSAVAKFGSLDILVNNAGFTWDGMIHKMSDEQWDAVIQCHSTAPFKMIRATVPHMRDVARQEKIKKDRVILNVSSTSGLHGNLGQCNYAMAKSGLVGFTKTIAKEWGVFGIRCNAVAFGMMDTRMTQAQSDDTLEVGSKDLGVGMPAKAAEMWRNPGYLQAQIPLARLGSPEEAAGGLLMMASPFSTYITGHTLEVTGGYGI